MNKLVLFSLVLLTATLKAGPGQSKPQQPSDVELDSIKEGYQEYKAQYDQAYYDDEEDDENEDEEEYN